MRKYYIIFLLLIWKCLFSDIVTLTLSNVIDYALKNNIQIKQLENDVKIADAQLNQAFSDLFFPDINFTGNITLLDPSTVESGIIKERTNVVTFSLMDKTFTNETIIPGSTNAWIDNYSLGLGLTKSLFTGFRLYNNYRNKLLNLELAKLKLKDKKKEIEVNVINLFFSLFLMKENIKLVEDLDRSLLERLEYTKANYKAGIVSDYDVIRMEVQYKNNQPKLLKAKNAYKQAKLNLCSILGILDVDNYEFIGNLMDSTNISIPNYNEEEIIKKALSNDINIKNIDYSIEMMKINKSLIEANRLPVLTFFLNGKMDYKKYQQTDTERTFVFSGNTGLQFSFPIDDWLPFSKTANSINEIEFNIDKLEQTKKMLSDNLIIQVKKIIMQIEEAKENINSIKENVKQAKLGLDIANERYKYGNISSLEVTDAEVSYNQAQLNYLQAIFDYFSNILQLKKMID